MDGIDYAPSKDPRRPAPPPPAPGPPGDLWHPVRDLPHLRPGRVPLPGRSEARPPSLYELSGVGRDHRGVLRPAGPGPAGPSRRGRLAGAPGPAAGAGRGESPAALGVAARSTQGPTVSAEAGWSDARSPSVAWSRSCCPTATSSGIPRSGRSMRSSRMTRWSTTWSRPWAGATGGAGSVAAPGRPRWWSSGCWSSSTSSTGALTSASARSGPTSSTAPSAASRANGCPTPRR